MFKKRMEKTVKRWKKYSEVSEVNVISRRYFVMNAFDGALTMLGVVIGAYIAGIMQPLPIISAGAAGSIAMGVSGISGAYMTEKAERTKKLKKLEKSMLSNMQNGLHYKSHRFAAVFAAIVDGLSPALAAMVVISPFFLYHFRLVSSAIAFLFSIVLTLSILFLLGVYLAKISDESIIKYGIQMLVIGCLTAFLCIMISVLLGGNISY